jgi:hypothetical protein
MSDTDEAKRDVLREVAADLRGPDANTEAEKLAATVMRVSDLYDEETETTPTEIYQNMRTIMEISEHGGREL